MTGRIDRLEAENAVIISVLKGMTHDGAQELANRMTKCREDRLLRRARPISTYVEAVRAGPQYKCKTAACWACRKAHVRRKQQEAASLFKAVRNADCSLLTVNAAEPVACLDEVAEFHRLSRFGLNNWRNGLARHDLRFNNMMLYAVLEVQHDGTVYRPHLHIVLHHPSVDRQEIGDLARKQWPGRRRVQVQAFHTNKEIGENVKACVGYALKLDHEEWSSDTSASLYLWLRQRRSLRSLCTTMRSRNQSLVPCASMDGGGKSALVVISNPDSSK